MAARSGNGRRDGASILFRCGARLLTLMVLGSVLAGGCSTTSSSRGQMALEAIRPASGDSARWLRNAHYFNLMGRPDLALKELEVAYQQDPQNLRVVEALARNYEELGEFERAQKLYQEALNRHGSHSALENNLCFSYYQAGRWEEAEACFRRALARNPQNSVARNNLGLLYCRLGKLEEARRLWREAEGEGAAQSRMNQALAALGIKETVPLAPSPQTATTPAKKILTQAKIAEAPVGGATPGAVPDQGSPQPGKEPKTVAVAAQPAPPPQPAKPGPAAAPARGEPRAATASPTQPRADSPATTSGQMVKPSLTLEELLGNLIEVRNGNGVREIAFDIRTMLAREGFQVARIGNHIDFGMEQTTILYRPGAEKVARALNAKYFQTSRLEVSQKLPADVNIKIILGRDLLKQPQLLTQLAAPGDN